MKYLIFSDLHLHNWNYGSTIVDGMNSRLRDQARVLDQIASACINEDIAGVIFGGDLFHTHGKIDSAVLKVAYEGLDRIFKNCLFSTFLVGNHDTSMKTKAIHSLHWLKAFNSSSKSNDFARVTVVGTYHHDPEWHHSREKFSYLSYTEDKQEIVNFFAKANPVCFLHQGVSNVPMGSGFVINEVLSKDMIPPGVDVFTGHYHTHTKVSNNLTIIGSTVQLNWADEGETKGFLIYDTENGSIKQIESKAPKFVTYHMNNALREGRQEQDSIEGNFVRVVGYDDTHKEDIRKEFLVQGARSVEFIPEKMKAALLKPLSKDALNLPEIVKEYEKDKHVTEERSKIGKEIREC